jgi:2-oxo-3-hexenedioate decarboxylase
MSPQQLLTHYDSGQCWPQAGSASLGYDISSAYKDALAVRELRLARGEIPRGYKIGFTNRTIWPRYNVFGPLWGTVWNSTLNFCAGIHDVSVKGFCQPRIEPEIVFGFKETPKPEATIDDIYQSLDWIAPGFEVVQSHILGWKFNAADAIADGGLHGRLIVGEKTSVTTMASSAQELHALLAKASVALYRKETQVEIGVGANVLDSPVHALAYFLKELRGCPGATDIQAGDVVTTGTWTDAYPIESGQTWRASFSAPLSSLTVNFED